jgi:hypothetical protein
MKVRIIKTSAGYVPQAYTTLYYEEDDRWYSISSGWFDPATQSWSDPDYVYKYATHLTKWGAMRTLKKWIKRHVKGTKALEAFTKELENPNVVYEAEI